MYHHLDYLIKCRKAIVLNKDNSFGLDTVILNGKRYFIKDIHFKKYNELIAEELLKDYGMSGAHYDLALFNNKECLMTEDFKNSNSNYYFVADLLNDYTNYLKHDINDKDFKYIDNSLEEIWNSLDYRYRNNSNKEKIVYDLMDEITNLFIFDIITSQGDRHSRNIQIEENNKKIKLAPIYDNEKICSSMKCLQLTVDSSVDNSLEYCLEEFINISAPIYYEKIISNLSIISLDNLQDVFKRIEKNTKYKMSFEDKNYYIDNFFEHKRKIEKILKRKVIK